MGYTNHDENHEGPQAENHTKGHFIESERIEDAPCNDASIHCVSH